MLSVIGNGAEVTAEIPFQRDIFTEDFTVRPVQVDHHDVGAINALHSCHLSYLYYTLLTKMQRLWWVPGTFPGNLMA
jgi:hypothetical protein